MKSLFSFIFNVNNKILDGFAKGVYTSLLVAMGIECEGDLKASISVLDMSVNLITRSRGAYSCANNGTLGSSATSK